MIRIIFSILFLIVISKPVFAGEIFCRSKMEDIAKKLTSQQNNSIDENTCVIATSPR